MKNKKGSSVMSKTAAPTSVSLSSIIDRVGDSFSVNICNNGFMVEISGRNTEGDWRTAKIVCRTESELFDLIREIRFMPKDE